VQTLFGQTPTCDKSKISQTDKELLKQFSIEFKKAINSENKIALASLIKFPFNCDYCILDIAKDKNYNYLRVTKKLFDKEQYKIFFDTKLKTTINKYSTVFDILLMTYDETGKICEYNFGYGSVEPSKEWEGQQHFFSLEKVNGKYFITSAWTVP
jgi:hypothetical protein